jgi:hypothetical protein
MGGVTTGVPAAIPPAYSRLPPLLPSPWWAHIINRSGGSLLPCQAPPALPPGSPLLPPAPHTHTLCPSRPPHLVRLRRICCQAVEHPLQPCQPLPAPPCCGLQAGHEGAQGAGLAAGHPRGAQPALTGLTTGQAARRPGTAPRGGRPLLLLLLLGSSLRLLPSSAGGQEGGATNNQDQPMQVVVSALIQNGEPLKRQHHVHHTPRRRHPQHHTTLL